MFDDETVSMHDETTDADIEDWDNLSHITLLSAVEDELGIEFFMEQTVKLEELFSVLKMSTYKS